MHALTQEQIGERIALYQRYAEAQAKYAEVEAAMPVEAPSDIRVDWFEKVSALSDASERTTFVVRRAWPALRKAVLSDAKKELDEAEQAVLKFERGEDVNAPQ